jgi:hypothetical protein
MTVLPAVAKIELAKKAIERLRHLGFRPHLGDRGELLIEDVLGNRRDALRYAPTLFSDIVAGLDADPGLLDRDARADLITAVPFSSSAC